jgi:two-component system sensor histidine kinase AlgZ
MVSIRQKLRTDGLPDFRNLGVIARTLLGVHALVFAIVLAAHPDLAQAVQAFVRAAALLEPALVASLCLLAAATPWLRRLPYGGGFAAALALAGAAAAASHALLGEAAPAGLARTLAYALAAAALVLAYLRLRERAFSPALAEARLAALQSRIRPHFLFNSLNTVLALMRRDPRRAEQALEDLAELFRALMSDARTLVPLAEEVALAERYAAIEQLRLGERLRLAWDLDAAPMDALLPPLVLQPVLENAVHHGIEPSAGPGEVSVRIERRGDRVRATVENTHLPASGAEAPRPGNRIALENIRERLALYFDAEARLETRAEAGRFCVEIDIPYRSQAA